MLKLELAALLASFALASASIEDNFAVFRAVYKKQYKTPEEERYRLEVYRSNMARVEEHNKLYAKGESSFYLGENLYADMTVEEFRDIMNGFAVNNLKTSDVAEDVSLKDAITSHSGPRNDPLLPVSVDWRKKGYVTPVKDTGRCKSSWAFSATGALEGAHFKAKGQLVRLSESNLVDCSQNWGNKGCQGGTMDNAFRYVIDNKGIDTEASYPYTPETGNCTFSNRTIGATERNFTKIPSGDEHALKEAIVTIGPISAAIDASPWTFLLYRGGIYDERRCKNGPMDVNRGVLVVGYGCEAAIDYWLVKNSMSEHWGIKGYIMMSRNRDNQCGIATAASYPAV